MQKPNAPSVPFWKKNTSPKSKGEKNQQTNSPQENPKRKYINKKKYLTKI